jgi:hypothetical protein
MIDIEARAQAARQAARDIGDTLYEKQKAYGDAGRMNLKIWEARLEQYLLDTRLMEETVRIAEGAIRGELHPYPPVTAYFSGNRMELLRRLEAIEASGDRAYLIPASLIAHIGRLTRIDDRIARIVSNPAGDRMGEDPWRDLAGDAVIGMIMPRTDRGEPAPAPHPSDTRIWAEELVVPETPAWSFNPQKERYMGLRAPAPAADATGDPGDTAGHDPFDTPEVP